MEVASFLFPFPSIQRSSRIVSRGVWNLYAQMKSFEVCFELPDHIYIDVFSRFHHQATAEEILPPHLQQPGILSRPSNQW